MRSPRSMTPGVDDEVSRDGLEKLLIAARAHLALGAADAACEMAASAAAAAVARDMASVAWRAHHVLALGLDLRGDADEAARARATAVEGFELLASRIADPALREWFLRQPLAPV